MISFSVVISTYSGETASNLMEALASIVNQSLKPSDLIIVVDGPVPEAQIIVINEITRIAAFPVKSIYLQKNQGRGVARNVGIAEASGDFVALMDSDDISLPSRFENQITYLNAFTEVDVVAGWTEEFIESDGKQPEITVVKYCPTEHGRIVSALRWSNCVANPTLIFRKSCWVSAGGFPDFKEINEDYLFYLRLIRGGAIFSCIPEIVLKVRINPEQRKRRRGFNILKSDLIFRFATLREGHIGIGANLIAIPLILLRRLAPAAAGERMQYIWRYISKFLHS